MDSNQSDVAMDPEANRVIDSLGGTQAVAELFSIKAPSVSEWRRTGIPEARLMYLKLLRPDVFRGKPEIRGPDRRHIPEAISGGVSKPIKARAG